MILGSFSDGVKLFAVHVTVHRDIFLIIKPTRCTNFSNLFWNETLHVSDTSSVHHQEFFFFFFLPYTQQWYMSYRFADSLQARSGWNPNPAVCTVKNS